MDRFHQAAFERGRSLLEQQGPFARPLFVLAHHDDEVTTAGLLQRLGPAVRIVWVTNSDGLYFESSHPPPVYGRIRKAEGIRSARAAGIPEDHTACLDFSEVEIYRRLSGLHAGTASVHEVLPFFSGMRDAVRDAVLQTRPDIVVTLAWQGGQPEHDLTHLFTRLALDDLERETGERPAFLHFPAYEYTILLAMRFHPLYRGPRMRIRLTPGELQIKQDMIRAYPSQEILFGKFRQVFRYLVRPASRILGGPRSIEQFLSVEEFGPVPAGLDYTANPHWFDFFSYMFDDFEGTPVTYTGSIRPLVRALLP